MKVTMKVSMKAYVQAFLIVLLSFSPQIASADSSSCKNAVNLMRQAIEQIQSHGHSDMVLFARNDETLRANFFEQVTDAALSVFYGLDSGCRSLRGQDYIQISLAAFCGHLSLYLDCLEFSTEGSQKQFIERLKAMAAATHGAFRCKIYADLEKDRVRRH